MTAHPRGDDPGVVERDGELGLISAALARAVRGAGGLVVVEGQAGVGKTALLRLAGALGEADGARVLRGRGSELDRAFPFGLVRQLLDREVIERPSLLGGDARAAAPVFGVAGPEALGRELHGSLQGLHRLVAALAAEQPLVLVADDLHWADDESLRALVFLADRLEEIPALIVAATRPAEPGADQDLLDALVLSADADVARPSPLSPAATAAMVRARLPGASEGFATACHQATGGNPFLLGELITELLAEGVDGSAGDAERVPTFGSERIGRAVRRRLRGLSPAATGIARSVAVLGAEARLADVAALAGCDEPTASASADALVDMHLLAAAPALEFVHPVVGSAVYEQIPFFERQALHAAAADRLGRQGADSERVARHLLRLGATGDAARADALRDAAGAASARGAAPAAARYLRRALEEPPAATERSAVLRELGVAEATDRQRGRFIEPFRQAIALAEDEETRAGIALDLGRALGGSGDFGTAADVLTEALDQRGDHGDLGAALEAELLAMSFNDFAIRDATLPRWERRLAQLAAGDPLAVPTRACLVLALATSLPPASAAVALAEPLLGAPELRRPNSVVAGMLGNGLLYAGASATAAAFFDTLIGISADRGNRLDGAWQLLLRSEVSLRLGELRRAEVEALRAAASIDGSHNPQAIAWTDAAVLSALVARGSLAEAEALAERTAGFEATESFSLAALLTARADLHVAQGRAAAALQDARRAGSLLPPGVTNPWSVRWRAPAALGLAGMGRTEEATAVAEDELATARAFAIPAAEGAALRTLGLVTRGPDGLGHLRASVARLEGDAARFEHARSLLELGAGLRHAGERAEARDVLRGALDATTRLGADGLAGRAREELVAAGARPRRDRPLLTGREALTAGEDRVATLAAAGLTNREIALRQFVTVKAVQFHLGNAYRKLDISSRADLPAALGLADQDGTLDPVAQRGRPRVPSTMPAPRGAAPAP